MLIGKFIMNVSFVENNRRTDRGELCWNVTGLRCVSVALRLLLEIRRIREDRGRDMM